MKHFIKDMKIAQEEAVQSHLHLQILQQALKNYEDLAKKDAHNEELGTQALITHYTGTI